jgi:hypothetical protein
MNFENDAHKSCYEKVNDYMTQLYGESAGADSEDPVFYLSSGSATVQVRVQPWYEHTVVAVLSWVVTEVEASKELLKYLLNENFQLLFGAFAVDDQNDILFNQILLGDTIDKEELRTTISAVAETADRYDDEIVKRFGGMTATDRAAAAAQQSNPA